MTLVSHNSKAQHKDPYQSCSRTVTTKLYVLCGIMPSEHMSRHKHGSAKEDSYLNECCHKTLRISVLRQECAVNLAVRRQNHCSSHSSLRRHFSQLLRHGFGLFCMPCHFLPLYTWPAPCARGGWSVAGVPTVWHHLCPDRRPTLEGVKRTPGSAR